MSAGLRVVVGEDSYLVREGIVRTLEEGGRLEVVAAEGDYDALLDAVERTRPDVVLTDIRMPPTQTDEGIRVARALDESHPEVGVVLLSQHVVFAYAEALFEHGNDRRGYVLKERVAEPAYLVEAIELVARGVPVVDPRVIGRLVGTSSEADEGLDSLTEREREVLSLVAEGLSNAAIAERLVLTTRAVERHINSIFAKLGLRDAVALNRRVVAALMYERSRD